MTTTAPRIVLLEEAAKAGFDAQGLLEAEGWTIDRASADDPPAIRPGQDLPVVILVADSVGPAAALVVQCLHQVAPEIPILLVGSDLEALRRNTVRDLGLFGVWDTRDDPDRLLEMVDAAAALLGRLRTASRQQDLEALLVAKLCHDLRGSLHAIRGYSEMLELSDSSVDVDVVRDRINVLSRKALDMAGEYLDLARLGRTAENPEDDAVRLEDLLSDLQDGALARIGDRPIELSASTPTPDAVIHTDGRRLRAVLGELLANAIKFTAAGQVRLRAAFGDGLAEFHVSDDGSGLERERVDRGVAAFEQTRASLLAPIPGQGIGLAMALRLIEQLGGTLSLEPGATGGASFRLVLPAHGEPSVSTYH